MPTTATNPLLWIIGSSILMCILALAGALTFSLSDKALHKILLPLVALSAGSLLGGAFFHNAYFTNAVLQKSNLKGTNLRFSNWESAYLEQVNLRDSTIQLADFANTTLRETDFSNAQIFDTDFSNANFKAVVHRCPVSFLQDIKWQILIDEVVLQVLQCRLAFC